MSEEAKSFADSETGERAPEADRLNDKELEQVSGGTYTAALFCKTCGIQLYTTKDMIEHRSHDIIAKLINTEPQGIVRRFMQI